MTIDVIDLRNFYSQRLGATFHIGEHGRPADGGLSGIVQQPNAQGVFVAKDKGDPVFVPIVIGATVNDKTEVKSGLTGNEQVLLSFPPGTRAGSGIITE